MNDQEIIELMATQYRIREILIRYGCGEEYSDAMLDEICNATGVKNTGDVCNW